MVTALVRILFCLIWISAPTMLQAQRALILNNNATIELSDYQVLSDAKYGLNRILGDASLVFMTDSMNTSMSDAYWIKLLIYNPYPNAENYLISMPPLLNYTCYTFAADDKKWICQTAGLNSQKQVRQSNVVMISLAAERTNTIYLKVDLSELRQYTHVFKPVIKLEKEVTFKSREQFLTLFFYICCTALISFACYNLYLYFNLKDDAYFYYVVVQFGSLLFFIGDNLYFNVLLPLRIYDVTVINGELRYYHLDYFFEHIGVAILFWGFVQFTRSYLNTKAVLPKHDKFLMALAYTYVGLETVPAIITLSGLYYLDVALAVNAFILVIIIACLGTAVISYRRKVIAAKHFLLANLLPATFAISASAHILIYATGSELLPTMAILSQIFTFAVALVARVKLSNDNLNKQAAEAMQLKMDATAAAYERLLMEQQHLHMKLSMELEQEKNDKLQLQLEANQRELVGNSVQLHQKSKLLSDLKAQLQGMDATYLQGKPEVLRSIRSSLKDNQYLDEKWDDFKLHFEQLHPGFFKDLLAVHPGLTSYELRLYAYFHINLSTKEIAKLLNIAPASVRQAKTRLYKKIRGM